MPMYVFKCKCGKTQEVLFGMNDKHFVVCKCGKYMKKDFSKMIPAYHDVPVDSIDTHIDGPLKPFVYHTKKQLIDYAKSKGLRYD